MKARVASQALQLAQIPNIGPAMVQDFERLGIDALDTLLPRGAEMLVDGVAAYTASVDELILRAITPSEELADYDRFVETAGALLAR